MAALPSASQARAGRSRDASSATEMSADSAAVRRPDQASAHPASWRAVSRSSGSAVTARARVARSCTQSPWPVGTAADAAATSLRAWSCGVGAEFGRAFHRQRGGGRTAAVLRLGRGGLQQRSHLLVRVQGRGGQVPGSPVGLVVQGLGELAVRRGPLREGRGVVDGGADEGMGELQPGPVYLDQAQLLGRRRAPAHLARRRGWRLRAGPGRRPPRPAAARLAPARAGRRTGR